jgi:hypothetical protein
MDTDTATATGWNQIIEAKGGDILTHGRTLSTDHLIPCPQDVAQVGTRVTGLG